MVNVNDIKIRELSELSGLDEEYVRIMLGDLINIEIRKQVTSSLLTIVNNQSFDYLNTLYTSLKTNYNDKPIDLDTSSNTDTNELKPLAPPIHKGSSDSNTQVKKSVVNKIAKKKKTKKKAKKK